QSLEADLMFLSGAYFASQNRQEAFEILRVFLQRFPQHASAVDAKLALAELRLNQVPPQPNLAEQLLAEIQSTQITDQQKERLHYDLLWNSYLAGDVPMFLQRSEKFLLSWPNSRFGDQVMVLLGKTFYERRAYGKASYYFRMVENSYPDSYFHHLSSFFAAKSQSMEGVELDEAWQSALKVDDDVISLQARHEKALHLLQEENFQATKAELDWILSSAELPENLRAIILSDKGHTLYQQALSEKNDKDLLAEAAEVFAHASRDSAAPAAIRYQASIRRAKCLEFIGNNTVALEIYQSIVREAGGESVRPGFDQSLEAWVFRAGFAALDLLEREQDWKGAIGVAEQLGRRNSIRSIEAARRAEQLRLEHFVWE
ncbi:MAG: tetratricopeptide repeat protein, partial [Verrucomicrobiota bacterium]